MTDIAIKVENLSKLYHIGLAQNRHDTLRDQLVSSTRRLFRRRASGDETGTIWALKDVSFEVKRGDVLGIIGRNGAGKSTLLKILSQITEPTAGRAIIDGRVGSLLEVGTGFHPELTGRENIYLNGAILGMTRKEIKEKFDEIVDFAEIEKFIDTPVKRYSSGMYVRLAFAVAAHLEPEILLIDEVLAVGDTAFQKKCLGKIGNMASGGRTVLFVSHNMAAIQGLCSRGILLKQGELLFYGTSRMAVDQYLRTTRIDHAHLKSGIIELEKRTNPYHPEKLIIRKAILLDHEDKPNDNFLMGQPMKIVIDVQGLSELHGASIGVVFLNQFEDRITSIHSDWTKGTIQIPRTSKEQAKLLINSVPFTPGKYFVSLMIYQKNSGRLDFVDKVAEITVIESDIYGTGVRISSQTGYFYIDGTWEIKNY
jgi:lipopolysaccharide transport system ATP-binding protein